MPRIVIPSPTSVPNGPDLDGWRDAHDRLRLALGQDITFQIPEAQVWDPAVQLDPETGMPYDPTLVPISGGGFTTATIRVTVVWRPIKRGNAEDSVTSGNESPGVVSDEQVGLIVAEADHGTIQDANGFTLNGKDFRITDIEPSGLGGIDRYIVYGQAR